MIKQLLCKHTEDIQLFIENYHDDARNYATLTGKPFTIAARSVWLCVKCNSYYGKAAHYALDRNTPMINGLKFK